MWKKEHMHARYRDSTSTRGVWDSSDAMSYHVSPELLARDGVKAWVKKILASKYGPSVFFIELVDSDNPGGKIRATTLFERPFDSVKEYIEQKVEPSAFATDDWA